MWWIEVKEVSRLNKQEYKALKRLSLGEKGLMAFYLESAFNDDPIRKCYRLNERVIILKDSCNIKCWALLLKFRRTRYGRWKNVIMIYTRVKSRKMGYADKVIARAIQMSNGGKLFCMGNSNFFNRYNITYAK